LKNRKLPKNEGGADPKSMGKSNIHKYQSLVEGLSLKLTG
jgi:hypothetical protein